MDKGLDGGDERAVSGKPDRLMGPETVVVEAGRFTEDVVAAAMSVAGKVVERLELAKDGKVSFRHQRVFALFLDDLGTTTDDKLFLSQSLGFSAIERGAGMKSPYGLDILDNCTNCPVREQHLFCNLSLPIVQRLNDITSSAVYPRGAVLFMEGQKGRGAFVLCTGKAKLSTTSRDGRTIITKISEHGDVLGLNATISNRPYEVTAEMVEPGQANFIAADPLLQFLHDSGEVATRVAQQLSRDYYSAYEEIRTLGLSNSPSYKFAKLLLGWSAERGDADHSLNLHLVLTHEEVGETIGTTRETVSRLFADFRKKQFIQSKGTSLVILNKLALEGMAQG